MTLRNIFMYAYNLLWRHNCGYLYSEERTTGGFLRMATEKPPCVIIIFEHCSCFLRILFFYIYLLINRLLKIISSCLASFNVTSSSFFIILHRVPCLSFFKKLLLCSRCYLTALHSLKVIIPACSSCGESLSAPLISSFFDILKLASSASTAI